MQFFYLFVVTLKGRLAGNTAVEKEIRLEGNKVAHSVLDILPVFRWAAGRGVVPQYLEPPLSLVTCLGGLQLRGMWVVTVQQMPTQPAITQDRHATDADIPIVTVLGSHPTRGMSEGIFQWVGVCADRSSAPHR